MIQLNTPDPNILPEQEDMKLYKMFTLIDLDQEFANTPDAKIINTEHLVSKKLSEDFTKVLYSNSGGELGFAPSCSCGNIRGLANKGMKCPLCETECSSQFVDSLSHNVWIGIPECMPPVMHPIWYKILKEWSVIGRRDVSIIDIIMSNDDLPADLVPLIPNTGFQYLHDHIDEIMDVLINKYQRTAKKPITPWIREFYKVYKNVMFTRKLPILHNSLHPLKNTGGSLKYVDRSSKEILAAIIDLSNAVFKMHSSRVTNKQMNKTLYEVYTKIMSYYKDLIDNKLGKKPALLRKHCYGSRVHFSFRSVIVPHNEILAMDEVILPWGIVMNGLKLVILNYLIHRRNMSVDAAIRLFNSALQRYDPVIDECIQTYIAETDDKCIYFQLGRNPTLTYGSIQLLKCRKYGKDPHDESIAINAGIVELPNADFDG